MVSLAFRYYKIQLWPGHTPDPAGGPYNTPPGPLIGWGWDTLSPFPIYIDAFGTRRDWPAIFQILLPPIGPIDPLSEDLIPEQEKLNRVTYGRAPIHGQN